MPKITPISWKVLTKLFEQAEFKLVREKGDHLIYIKDGIIRPVVIPKYNEIPVFVIKNNLRTAQINRDEYFKLLKNI